MVKANNVATAAHLNKVVVYGVGLIGGSFALALKQAGVVAHVVGLGRSTAPLEAALVAGVIDEIGTGPAVVADADIVLLAMPVGQMEAAMVSIAPYLTAKTVVTDAGSTKQDVVAAAQRALGQAISQFVPGHPIAGAEKSGVAAANADLYQGKRVVLTPLPENAEASVAKVTSVWQACGALVSHLAAETHDAVFAAVSHLPHVLAFALVESFAARTEAGVLFANAGAGFRDFTRIASSNPEMWRDISLANRSALIAELDQYMQALLNLRFLLAAADGDGLEQLFTRARDARNAWLEQLEK